MDDANIKLVEFVFRHEREIRESLNEAVSGEKHESGGVASNVKSDRTASQAIRLADGVPFVEWYECPRGRRRSRCVGGCKQYQHCLKTLHNPAQWLTVCAAVADWCKGDTIRREVFRRKYAGFSRFSTMRRLHIAERTYYSVVDDIRSFALQCACQLQLIKAFDVTSGNRAGSDENTPAR